MPKIGKVNHEETEDRLRFTRLATPEEKAALAASEAIGTASPAPSPPSSRRERLAVNLPDLDRVDPTVRAILVAPFVSKLPEDLIRADKDRMDEVAVLFICDLVQAACICDTLRNHDRRAGDPPTRLYLQKKEGGAWERLPGAAVLTVMEDGRAVLNPILFPREAVKVAARPKGFKVVKIGVME